MLFCFTFAFVLFQYYSYFVVNKYLSKSMSSSGRLSQQVFTCSKLTSKTPKQYVESAQSKIKTPENHERRRFGVFFVSFEQISHIVLVFP